MIKLNDEQQELVTSHKYLVEKYIEEELNKNSILINYKEEFRSEILYRLCVAAIFFKKEARVRFSTYARTCFVDTTESFIKDIKNNSIFCLSENNLDLIEKDYIIAIREDIFNSILKCSSLKKREEDILISHYYKDVNYRELGKKYNISGERVGQIAKKAISKIAHVVKEEDFSLQDFYTDDKTI